MPFTLASSPHHRVSRNTSQVMQLVILATVPGIAVQTWFFGFGTLVHIGIACLTAVVTEALFLELRKKDFETAIKDCSALLTAVLLAISIPPFAPWWITVIGTFFAIAIVKQLYGGLGYNLFNPAMAAYVMLLISFPVQMTSWIPPISLAENSHDLVDAIHLIFSGFSAQGYSLDQLRTGIDGVTMATPLDTLKTDLNLGLTYSESLEKPIFSDFIGAGWGWVNLAYLFGGLYLLKQKVINWHIPVSLLGAVFACALLMYLVDADHYGSPIFHLFSGGLMLGAFFIATDPVSASTTNNGRLIFGAMIGFWIYVIRTWGGYPDAIGFAVIIMNMAVPLIDYYTRPRTYGQVKKPKMRAK